MSYAEMGTSGRFHSQMCPFRHNSFPLLKIDPDAALLRAFDYFDDKIHAA